VGLDDAPNDTYGLTALRELVDDAKFDQLREPIDADVAGSDGIVDPWLNEADPLPRRYLLDAHAEDRRGAFNGCTDDVVRGWVPFVVH
jgi:hypothetical protein